MSGEVVAGQGSSFALITGATARIKNVKINPKGDSKDITHTGSAGWKYTRTVLKSANGSMDLEAWPGDLVSSVGAGTFITSSETGSKTYTGSWTILEISPTVAYDDIVKWNVVFESYGPISIS